MNARLKRGCRAPACAVALVLLIMMLFAQIGPPALFEAASAEPGSSPGANHITSIIKIVEVVEPKPPGKMTYNVDYDTLTIDFADGVPTGGAPTGRLLLTIRVLDPSTGLMSITLQHVSGCAVKAKVCGQEIISRRGTAVATKTFICQPSAGGVLVDVMVGILHNVKGITNTGYIKFETVAIPLEKHPQAVIGTRIILNETLGNEKPIIYLSPAAVADRQYISAASLTVRQLTLPPGVYQLMPDYAVRGYLYSMTDAMLWKEWRMLFGSDVQVPEASWVEGPTWEGSPDDPGKVTITGRIEVTRPAAPIWGFKFAFPFGTVYSSPPRISNLTVAQFDNLTYVVRWMPDSAILQMPWVTEAAPPDVIFTFVKDMMVVVGIGAAAGYGWGRVVQAAELRAAEPAARRLLDEIEDAVKRWPKIKEAEQEIESLINKWMQVDNIDHVKVTLAIPASAVASGLANEILHRMADIAREVEARKNEELNAELEQLYAMYVAPDPEGFKENPQLVSQVVDMMNSIAERKAREAGEEVRSRVQYLLDDYAARGAVSDHVIQHMGLISIPMQLWWLQVRGAGVVTQATIYGSAGALIAYVGLSAIAAWREEDVAGVKYIPVLTFLVRDNQTGAKYLVYKAWVPDWGYGLWPYFETLWPAKSAEETVKELMDAYIESKDPSIIARPQIEKYGDVTEILYKVQQGFEMSLGQMIEQATGIPGDRLVIEELGFASIYIPYHFVTGLTLDRYIFPVNVVERGITMSLTGVKPHADTITDPEKIIEIIGPITVNNVAYSNWEIKDGRATISLDIGKLVWGGEPVTLNISTFNPVARFFADVELSVDHFYMFNLTRTGPGFGMPCIIDPATGEPKEFIGLLKIIYFALHYVLGDAPYEPPSSASLKLSSDEALELYYYGEYRPEEPIREPVPGYEDLYRLIYTSPLYLVPLTETGKASYLLVVGKEAWTWTKVDEIELPYDNATQTWYVWDGVANIDEIPMVRFIVKCGVYLDVVISSIQPGEKRIGGEIILNGGTSPIPTQAEFIFYTNSPSDAWAEVIYLVGVYESADGREAPKYVRGTTEPETISDWWSWRYRGYPAARRVVDMTEVTTAALELASRLNRTVYIIAFAKILRAPEGFTVWEPSAKVVPVNAPPAPPGNLTVHVRDALDLAPIGGAFVTVYNKTHQFTGLTNEMGLVKFTGLMQGGYYVNVTVEGYVPFTSGKDEPVIVVGGRENNYTALLKRLPPGNATLTVVVIDAATGARIRGATVEVTNGTQAGTYVKYTGDDGTAVFSLRRGKYTLNVYMEGYEKYTREVQLEEDETIKVPLNRLLPYLTMTVRVLDAVTKGPIQGALVAFENGTTVFYNYTNEDGVAVIRLPKGGYLLRIEAANYHPISEDIFVTASALITRELVPLTVQPEPPIPPNVPECTVPLTTIRVVDITTGNPVEGATVILERGWTYTGETDSNGEARFCISTGQYSFMILHPSYAKKTGSIFILQGNTYTFELTPLSEVPRAKFIVVVEDATNGSLIDGGLGADNERDIGAREVY